MKLNNEISRPLFYVKVKIEALNDPTTSFLKGKIDPNLEYPVICTAGDRFVLVTDNDEFVEIYPRKCLFAGYPIEDSEE
jgi:hypothetical protein